MSPLPPRRGGPAVRDDAGGPCADDMQVQEAADRPQTGRLLAGRRTGTPRRDPGPQEARRGGERVPHRLAASGLLSRAAGCLVPHACLSPLPGRGS